MNTSRLTAMFLGWLCIFVEKKSSITLGESVYQFAAEELEDQNSFRINIPKSFLSQHDVIRPISFLYFGYSP